MTMKIARCFSALISLLLFVLPEASAELSDALKVLATDSDLIVVATVIDPPEGASGSAPIPSEKPVAYWTEAILRVNFVTIVKGSPDPGNPLISARIPAVADVRQSDNIVETMARRYARGRKCILFLQDRRTSGERGKGSMNGEAVNYVAFDPFFSCQSYDRAMEVELRELMARKK